MDRWRKMDQKPEMDQVEVEDNVDGVGDEVGQMDRAEGGALSGQIPLSKKTGWKVLHKRTETMAENIRQLAILGLEQDKMGKILGLDPKTLRKHYADEIDNTKARLNGQIAMGLARRALDGDTVSSIFWLKAQAGWRDQHIKVDGDVRVHDTAKHRLLDILATGKVIEHSK